MHMLYVNGTFVGRGTDRQLPSEYGISAALTSGKNELEIVVCRFSAQSYLEATDGTVEEALQYGIRSLHIPSLQPELGPVLGK